MSALFSLAHHCSRGVTHLPVVSVARPNARPLLRPQAVLCDNQEQSRVPRRDFAAAVSRGKAVLRVPLDFARNAFQAAPILNSAPDTPTQATSDTASERSPSAPRVSDLADVSDLPAGMLIRSANDLTRAYRLMNKLGQGVYGVVYGAEEVDTKRRCALKIQLDSQPDTPIQETFEREAETMAKLPSHPHVANMLEHFVLGNRVVIVTDWYEHGNLAGALEAREGELLNEAEVMRPLVQMMLALGHLHERSVAHRDIKTDNIYLNKRGDVKLGDFGNCRDMEECRANACGFVGTPQFMAPEVLRREESDPNSSDIWSLGVVAYELCTLTPYFQSTHLAGLYQEQADVDGMEARNKELQKQVGPEMAELVSKMLCIKPEGRPSIKELLKLPIVQRHLSQLLENVDKSTYCTTVKELYPAMFYFKLHPGVARHCAV